MERRTWCYPGRLTDEVREAARAAGVTELVRGIPPRLAGLVDPATLGELGRLVVVEEPEPVLEPDLSDVVRALRTRLQALEARVAALEGA